MKRFRVLRIENNFYKHLEHYKAYQYQKWISKNISDIYIDRCNYLIQLEKCRDKKNYHKMKNKNNKNNKMNKYHKGNSHQLIQKKEKNKKKLKLTIMKKRKEMKKKKKEKRKENYKMMMILNKKSKIKVHLQII